MSKYIIRIVLILVVAGVIGLLAYNKISKDKALSLQAEAMKSGSSNVLLANGYVVAPAPLQNNIEATGTLLSNEFIQIQPEINGRITDIYFQEGAYVKKGTLLVKLFDGDLKAQMEKLKVQKRLADTTLARQEKLLEINGISRQAVDNTRNQVASYQSDLDYYEAEIRKTEIRAPFNGRIGLRQVSEGAIVSPTTVITKLYQNNPLKLEFSVPEKYRSQIKTGDLVAFTVAESPGEHFKGKIYAINPGIDPNTRTITLRAHVNNEGEKLSPGSFANVHIELRAIPNALMIPTEALIPTTKANQVIVSKQGKAKFINVETGIRTADKVQITSGLQAGDTVLTTGVMQAKPGVPLKIMELAADTVNDIVNASLR